MCILTNYLSDFLLKIATPTKIQELNQGSIYNLRILIVFDCLIFIIVQIFLNCLMNDR